jgi:hypothetical protein
MKIHILMSFFNRPLLVRNALKSILHADEYHADWRLTFGDDGSKTPGKPIVEEILKDHLHKVTFVHTGMTFQDKIEKGLTLGAHCNEAIKNSDADVGIMFCDDDELHPLYLKNLSEYFIKNPNVLYCHSLLCLFNPLVQESSSLNNLQNKYNDWTGPISPANKVDASQVAWRLDCCKKHGAWFADSTKCVSGKPWTKDTDKSFFENLYEKCGPCHPTGFVSQYKGVHDYQLLWHKNVGVEGLRAYDRMTRELGGVKF